MTLITSDSGPMLASIAAGDKWWMREMRREPCLGRGIKRGDTASSKLTAAGKRRERRLIKRAERRDLALEIIAEFAIEPDVIEATGPHTDHDEWLDITDDWWNDFDRDDFGDDDLWDGTEWDEFDEWLGDRTYGDLLTELEVESGDAIDLLSLTDEDLPGWGTHFDWEDLQGLTITRNIDARGHARCPWGWSTGTTKP